MSDDLQRLIAEVSAERPQVAAMRADQQQIHALVDELVHVRRVAGLSQAGVAKSMNVTQPTVSEFESEASDPRLSTLQRYARAVGVQLALVVKVDGAP